ncbi:YciI family protein [Streptomyces gobiensis]|uniref:YciI family protein n=1 Tax=Streptomyces gobiensis TaxID=2875706 RepID=UPI0030D3C682
MIMLHGTQAAYDAMKGIASRENPAWTEADLKAMFDHMGALNNELTEAGELVDGQGLSEPRQARLVTADTDGTPVVSDTPYGETGEVLAGYWVVDVESIDRATEIAARAYRCPVPEGTYNPPVVVQPIPESGAGFEM